MTVNNLNRGFDYLQYALHTHPKDDFLVRKAGGQWIKTSTAKAYRLATNLSCSLLRIGLQAGDRVAIISANRTEWVLSDIATQQAGLVNVPMYPTISAEDYHYIFKHSGVRLIIVDGQALYDKAKQGAEGIEGIIGIYSFDEVTGALPFSSLLVEPSEREKLQLENIKESILPSDLLTIIYTSGTTGAPKGVMLSHANITSNVDGAKPFVPVDARHKALSFLPLCHAYERMLSMLYIRFGVSVYYAESIETISDNLKEVKPHIFATVPRLLEKVYDKILLKGYDLKGIKKSLFFWALNLGLNYEPWKNNGFWFELQLKLARKLIFSKWQEALGGNLIGIVTGGAALQPRLARVFWAANIRVMEGYGLTETSPVVSVNAAVNEDMRVGTVGLLLPKVQVKIAADGEILVKGPNVMVGYYGRPDLTAEVIDTDGWFHTGDIGEMVEGRFLKITDRKKEIFKTSGGKYIVPQKLENMLKESLVVEQAMIVGDGERYAAALIVPSIPNLKDWCKLKGISYNSEEQMLKLPEVQDKFQRTIEELNARLGQTESVKKFCLLPTPWTVETGELSPKHSLKRKFIIQKYSKEMASLFQYEK